MEKTPVKSSFGSFKGFESGQKPNVYQTVSKFGGEHQRTAAYSQLRTEMHNTIGHGGIVVDESSARGNDYETIMKQLFQNPEDLESAVKQQHLVQEKKESPPEQTQILNQQQVRQNNRVVVVPSNDIFQAASQSGFIQVNRGQPVAVNPNIAAIQ